MDLNPPPWRNQPGSTFQTWEFQDPPPNWPAYYNPAPRVAYPIPPTRRRNPYVTNREHLKMYPCGVAQPHSDWMMDASGKFGIWRLSRPDWLVNEPSLSVIVPNCGDEDMAKEAWLQVAYRRVSGDPEVYFIASPRGAHGWIPAIQPYEVEKTKAPPGWTHRTYKYRMPFCPDEEHIDIYPPADLAIYVGPVTLDTICRKAAPAKKKKRRRKG